MQQNRRRAQEYRRSRDDPDPNLNIDPEIFPGYTEYEKFCCCCSSTKADRQKVCFCGNWLVDAGMPVFVSLLAIANIVLLYVFCLTKCKVIGYILVPLDTIFCFMFLFCFYKTIYLGPGYFPFYWNWAKQGRLPETDDLTVHGVDESLAGLAMNEVQYKWSKTLDQPPRCTMSRLAKRFVIRPDHYCGYVGTWIGKRNHKLFILFNFYGSFYCWISFVAHFVTIFFTEFETGVTQIIVSLIFGMMSLTFGVMTFQFYMNHTYMSKRNYTSWEKWNDYQKYLEDSDSEHAEMNQKQVFGENMSFCVKFCPFEAFPGKTNEELVEGYLPYASLQTSTNAQELV